MFIFICALCAVFFFGLFAAPASAAQGKEGKSGKVGGFNFLPALVAVCFSAIIGGTAFSDDDGCYDAWSCAPDVLAPLHFAVARGDIAKVNRLIDGGADVNKIFSDSTPLHWTSIHHQAEIADVLIKAGAHVNAKTENGYTALHYAASHGQTKIALALVKAGADLFARTNRGETPLDLAVKYRGKDSVIALFLQGAMERPAKRNRQKAEELLRKLE